jgi:hypothetical protein
MSEAGFQQAPIAVQNAESFEALKQLVDEAFSPARVESFLKNVSKADLGVRRFERVLERRLLELKEASRSAWALYQSLPTSDQGLMREYYLTKVEEVESSLRTKYQKIYRYW